MAHPNEGAEARGVNGCGQARPTTVIVRASERTELKMRSDDRAHESQKSSFKAHLLGGPKVDDWDIERDADTGRECVL